MHDMVKEYAERREFMLVIDHSIKAIYNKWIDDGDTAYLS